MTRHEALDDDSRDVLRQAAANTLQWTSSVEPSEADRAASFCDWGRVVHVPDTQVAAMLESAQPVYESLEEDEATRSDDRQDQGDERHSRSRAGGRAVLHLPRRPDDRTCIDGPRRRDRDRRVPRRRVSDGAVGSESCVDAGLDSMLASQYAGTWEMTFDEGAQSRSRMSTPRLVRLIPTKACTAPLATV